jgi:hypothetical protein
MHVLLSNLMSTFTITVVETEPLGSGGYSIEVIVSTEYFSVIISGLAVLHVSPEIFYTFVHICPRLAALL